MQSSKSGPQAKAINQSTDMSNLSQDISVEMSDKKRVKNVMTKLEGFKKEKLANLHTGTCTKTKQLANDLQITDHPETSYQLSIRFLTV